MTKTTLERPPTPPEAGPEPSVPPRRTPVHRQRPGRRVFLIGLACSLAIHLLLLYGSRYVVGVGPPAAPRGTVVERAVRPPEGLRVYDIAPTADAAPPVEEQVAQRRPALREDTPPPTDAEPAQPDDPADAEAAPSDAPVARPAELLAPHMGDRRLWVPAEELPPLSDEARMRGRIYGKLRSLNDSLRAAAVAAREARDWTFTDDEGRRWGLSPEGIHLGEITLPAPQLPGEREARERIREWEQIRAQAARARAAEVFEERVEAIRERKEEARAEDDGGGDGESP